MTTIKELMEIRNILARDLSDKTGIPIKTIYKYMSGATTVAGASFATGVKLAEALGVTTTELLGGDRSAREANRKQIN